MKFAHLADVHIGAWRDPKMAYLPDQAFEEAISVAIAEEVDFIIIAGDLFNTALPGIDHLKSAVRTLQQAKNAEIPIYVIPGSHDFSPSGKSMIHVLEEANLLINVFKGKVIDNKLQLEVFRDKKTNCSLVGIMGKKGMLDKSHYTNLDFDYIKSQINTEKKIFLFHTAITELKPKELVQMESYDVSMLPKGFDYYAGGHVHIVDDISLEGYTHVVYPGPVFPASFSELEKLKEGSMVIVEDTIIKRIPLVIKKVIPITINCEGTPANITEKIITSVSELDFKDAIVVLRIKGNIVQGSSGDIDFRKILSLMYAQGAYVVMRNTAQLAIEESVIIEQKNSSEMEETIIEEYLGKQVSSFIDEKAVIKSLLQSLSANKVEGETNTSYEERVVAEARKILQLD